MRGTASPAPRSTNSFSPAALRDYPSVHRMPGPYLLSGCATSMHVNCVPPSIWLQRQIACPILLWLQVRARKYYLGFAL